MKGSKWDINSYSDNEPLRPQWYWAIVLIIIKIKTLLYKTINQCNILKR